MGEEVILFYLKSDDKVLKYNHITEKKGEQHEVNKKCLKMIVQVECLRKTDTLSCIYKYRVKRFLGVRESGDELVVCIFFF